MFIITNIFIMIITYIIISFIIMLINYHNKNFQIYQKYGHPIKTSLTVTIQNTTIKYRQY